MKRKTTKKTPDRYVIGLDLGGTNVMAVLVTTSGKVIDNLHFPTEAPKGPDYVIENMAQNTIKLVEKNGLKMKNIWRIGIGSPGPLDSKKGIIMGAVNLPGWKFVRLKEMMEKQLGTAVGVDNDANCAAYGEAWLGAARGKANVVGITLGTGVGGGIIIDHKLVRGANYNAAEIGHTSLNPDGRVCKCGAKGCFEQYASASAIAESARERIRKGTRSMMTEMVKGDLGKLTSKVVAEAMEQGDKAAKETWDEFIKYLAAGVANQINGLNPDVVVIAGGVINAGDLLFVPLKEAVRKQTFALTFAAAKIVPAKLGELAGALGAAGVVINEGDFYGM
ncbi:MAG: ROK family protein [Spirochaetia bacterium]|nr:ROK family protein [Spirochaetia bacterium]